MAYERQVQIAMERLDQSLAKLHTLIKEDKTQKQSVLWKKEN